MNNYHNNYYIRRHHYNQQHLKIHSKPVYRLHKYYHNNYLPSDHLQQLVDYLLIEPEQQAYLNFGNKDRHIQFLHKARKNMMLM